MKKIWTLALVGVMTTTVAQINVSAAGETSAVQLPETVVQEQTVEFENASAPVASVLTTETGETTTEQTGEPALVITEISAYPMQVEFASLTGADAVVRDTNNVFEFIELHNYGTGALDLNDYQLTITNNGKNYVNPWKFEAGNDGVIEAGETFVVFNYTAGSYAYGPNDEYSMKHDTAENLALAWDTFNTFYGISVPVEHRVMSLVVDETGTAISGATQLPSTGSNSVRLVHKTDGTVAANSEYSIATLNLSHNYLQTETETAELLCVNGVSPYKLLHEQDVHYAPTFDFSGEKLRLVSYNLLFNGHSFETRASCFLDFLKTYSPDIMGLQEIAADWYGYLTKYLPALGYTYVEVTVQTGGGTVPTYHSDSSNPFIYKTDKFDLLDHGTRFVSKDGTPNGDKWDSVNRARTVNYAVFQSKATGNVVNVVNTHGILTGTQAKLEQIRIAKELAAEVEANYEGCTGVFMGDMNYDEGGKYYQNVLSCGKYVDSKYVAKNSTYRLTCANFGRFPYGATSPTNPWDQEASTIDYIFLTAGTQVKNYKVIDQAYYNQAYYEEAIKEGWATTVLRISDHSAVLVDAYV